MSKRHPSFAFVGWNPFQLRHALPVARLLPNSVFLVEGRADRIGAIDQGLLDGSSIPCVVWEPSKFAELDGIFDVVVCQTEFTKIEEFKKSKIAMLQYGLAKEPHNYGAWRSFADLTLAYGSYATERLQHFGPVASVGNPAMDRWHDAGYREEQERFWKEYLDPSKRTIAYVPTWGELSSAEVFLDAVLALAKHYNLIIKVHHNTAILDKRRAQSFEQEGVFSLRENDELLSALCVADVVLSDYSGAIFDAMYCQRPVLLLRHDEEQVSSDKVDSNSLEIRRSDDIGTVVPAPAMLAEAVAKALHSPILPTAAFVDQLFERRPSASERAAVQLLNLASGEVAPLTQLQGYVRDACIGARRVKFRTAWEVVAKHMPSLPKRALNSPVSKRTLSLSVHTLAIASAKIKRGLGAYPNDRRSLLLAQIASPGDRGLLLEIANSYRSDGLSDIADTYDRLARRPRDGADA